MFANSSPEHLWMSFGNWREGKMKLLLTLKNWGLVIVTMSALVSLGYSVRRVEGLEAKVNELSSQQPSAQVQQADTVWIKLALVRIETRLDKHEGANDARLAEIEKTLRARR